MVTLAPIQTYESSLDPVGHYARGLEVRGMREERGRRQKMQGILSQMDNPREASDALMAAGMPEEAMNMQKIAQSRAAVRSQEQSDRLAMAQNRREQEERKVGTIGRMAKMMVSAMKGIEDPKEREEVWDMMIPGVESEVLRAGGVPAAMETLPFAALQSYSEEGVDALARIGAMSDAILGAKPEEKTSAIKEYEYGLKDPGFAERQERLKTLSAPKTEVTVGGETSEYAKASDKAEAKADETMQSSLDASLSGSQSQKYINERMLALLDAGVETGKAEDWKLEAKRWGNVLGANFDTENEEEFVRLANEKAFAELAKFKGATSEKELSFSKQLVGNITGSEGAIRRYLALNNRMIERTEEMARELDTWKTDKGTVRGFRDYWREYQLDNPLVAQPKTQDEFDKLPDGTLYLDEGELYIK